MVSLDRRHYFKEQSDPEVKAFTIVESDSDRVRIAEKWIPKETWLTYWIEKDRLRTRLSANEIEHRGTLSDDTFRKVCESVDDSKVTA